MAQQDRLASHTKAPGFHADPVRDDSEDHYMQAKNSADGNGSTPTLKLRAELSEVQNRDY